SRASDALWREIRDRPGREWESRISAPESACRVDTVCEAPHLSYGLLCRDLLVAFSPGAARAMVSYLFAAAGIAANFWRAHMAQLTLMVDGRPRSIEVDDPDMPLLYALRDELQLNNPRFGCGLGQCGACTVQIDGHAVRSCITPVSAVAGSRIT